MRFVFAPSLHESNFLILIAITAFVMFVSGCAGTPQAHSETIPQATSEQAVASSSNIPIQGGEAAPPESLLRDNYLNAPVVLAVRIKQINIVDTLRDDDDKIGYVALEVTGDVIETYKAENIQLGQSVRYRFAQEYDTEWFQYWKAGEQVLAFLTLAGQGVLWVFDEAAHFHLTPELAAQMRQIAASGS
jgi:hypothetical protein